MTDRPFGRFFLPGPTEVHPDVLAAQTRPMIGHRGQEIRELMRVIEEGLRPVFGTTQPVVVSTSSATGLMEAAVRNAVGKGRVLALVNGAFSARFASIATGCGKDVEVWEIPWGEVHDPAELDSRLAAGSYEAVTVTHSETSTGALQDLETLARVTARHPDPLLLVDSVTGVGGVETLTDVWGVDFILTGSQKALALPPGLSFGVASPALLERARWIPDRGWYFDLIRLTDELAKRQTPATPAISLMYALEHQLARIQTEGLPARFSRHIEMRQLLIDWTATTPGVDVLAAEGFRSPTVSCLVVPDGARLVTGLAERGFVIGPGYGKLKTETVRIGHMGDHTVDETGDLITAMEEVL